VYKPLSQVIYYDAIRPSLRKRPVGVQYAPLDTLLATADIVSLHVPLNESTRHMIDAQALGRMNHRDCDQYLPGEVIEEHALIEALQQGGSWGPVLIPRPKSRLIRRIRSYSCRMSR